MRGSANKIVVWDPNWIMKLLPYWLVLIEPNGLPSLFPLLWNMQCTFYSALFLSLIIPFVLEVVIAEKALISCKPNNELVLFQILG